MYLTLSLARFYIPGPSPQGAVRPKLTPPHWGMVTMTTRALSKKVGVGAREGMLLRKIEDGPSPRDTVHPKLTPPHRGTVTMTTHALSKKAGVGAHERMLLRKNEGGLQSS